MNDALLLALLLVLLIGMLVICLATCGESLRDKKISVMYGYPAGCKTWLTVYYYRATDRWIFEWDDLFDEGRPESMNPASRCFMYRDKKSGATMAEFVEAEIRLKRRGLL